MIDIILIAFTTGVFYGGFVCGKKFQTIGGMLKAGKDWAAQAIK